MVEVPDMTDWGLDTSWSAGVRNAVWYCQSAPTILKATDVLWEQEEKTHLGLYHPSLDH
jgi:hypothetical protein